MLRNLTSSIISNFILFVSISHSAIPSSAQSEIYENFSNGMNTSVAAQKLNISESPFIQNFWIDEKPGSLVSRNGFTEFGSTSTIGKINFQFEYINESNVKEFIVSDSSIVLTTNKLFLTTPSETSNNFIVKVLLSLFIHFSFNTFLITKLINLFSFYYSQVGSEL